MFRRVGVTGVLIGLVAACGTSKNGTSGVTGVPGASPTGGAVVSSPGTSGSPSTANGHGGAASPTAGGSMQAGGQGASSAGSGGTSATGSGGANATNAAGASGAGIGASGSGAAGSGGSGTTGPIEPKIPMPPEPCPMLATGFVTIMGSSVQLWVGQKQEDKKAPILIYWHFTGGSSAEPTTLLSPTAMSEIMDAGGIIASPQNSTGMGADTGNGVWYTDDFKIADEVVACAVQQLNIDTHRIYTAGGSAGALQAGIMVYKRSSYLAASVPNSGGYTIGCNALEEPSHVPSVMTLHGAPGVDVVIVDFSVQSMVLDVDVAKKGGFAIDCNHGGGHIGAPPDLLAAGWQFLKDHPFGVSPEPYASGLPSSFPQYCKPVAATDMAPAGCCAQYGQCMGAAGAGGAGAGGASGGAGGM